MASELWVADRNGETTWKLDACLPGGAAAESTTAGSGAAAAVRAPVGGWRGSTDWIDPGSILTEPFYLKTLNKG